MKNSTPARIEWVKRLCGCFVLKIQSLRKTTAAPAVAVSGAENNAAVIQKGAQDTPDPDTRPDAEKYNFTLNDSEGNPHSLTDYVGKPLLLDFFGTWCSYCNMELPSLQKIVDNGEIEGVLIAALISTMKVILPM